MTHRTTSTGPRLLIAGLGLLLAPMAAADFPGFDDLATGTTYAVGDHDTSDGVDFAFTPMPWLGGGSGSGRADVLPPDRCQAFNRLDLNNITANFDFAGTIGSQTDLVFQTRHLGGQINLTVNGSAIAYAGDWMAYHNSMLGGVRIEVLSGGYSGDCTTIRLRGRTDTMSVALQEGWVDASWSCEEPTFDDLPMGDLYVDGDGFSTQGIPCKVIPYMDPMGVPFAGSTRIDASDLACGDGHEARQYTSAIQFDFSVYGGVNDLRMLVGDYANGVNLSINGMFRWAADWRDLDGRTIGGCLVTVPVGGANNECAEIRIAGHVDTMVVGGEESAIDCVAWATEGTGSSNEPEPGRCATYDDMVPGSMVIHGVGDSFATTGIACIVVPYRTAPMSSYLDGAALATPSMLACGSGQELSIYAAGVNHDFLASGSSMSGVSITASDHGGILNLGINGDLRIFNTFADIDGAIVGGVEVRVVSGGGTNECTELEFDGVLDNLRLGGGQLFLDCLEGTAKSSADPSDFNQDGVIDGQDLARLLASWSSDAGGDADGDGDTDGQDLAILLGRWAP